MSSYNLNKSTRHNMTGLEMEAINSDEVESGWQVDRTEGSGVYTAGRLYQRRLDNSGFDEIETVSATDSVDDFINDMGTVHAEKDFSPTMESFNDRQRSHWRHH